MTKGQLKFCISVFFIFSFMSLSPEASWAGGRFGYDGRDGRDGRSGQKGADGRDVEMLVRKSPVRIDVSGEDGEAATTDGENGADASSCMSYPRQPEYDLFGADGGNGGNGGDGGDGGRGGDVTLYYKDISQLKNITIVSRGSRGGLGTRSGSGGWGCRCFERSWTIRRCSRGRDNVDRCEYRTYMCQDGRNGFRGRLGRPGSTGAMGSLTLIQSGTPLPKENKSSDGVLGELNRIPITLTENVWQERDGAIALLAPGSILNDRYNEFVAHNIYVGLIDWQAPRRLQEFSDIKVRLALNAGQVTLAFPSEIWTRVAESENYQVHSFQIQDIIRITEVQDVQFELSGRERDANLTLRNAAKYASTLQNALHLRVWFDKALGDKEVFKSEIPADLLKVSGVDLVVNVGALEMREKNVFKPKRKMKWQAILTRTMGENKLVIDSGVQKHTVTR